MKLGDKGLGVAGCAIVAVLIVLGALAGGWLLAYDVNTIAAFFGKPAHVPPFNPITMLAGLVFSEVALPLALVVWLLHFVIA